MVAVLRQGQSATREDILGYLAGEVAKWWLPEDVVFVDELPHTATGKILKLELRKQYRNTDCPASAPELFGDCPGDLGDRPRWRVVVVPVGEDLGRGPVEAAHETACSDEDLAVMSTARSLTR